MCAPEIGAKARMSATNAAPVAMVLARSAMATLPPARSSPMVPEPMMAARSSAVASASLAALRANVIRALAYGPQLRLQREMIELIDPQIHQQAHAGHDLP